MFPFYPSLFLLHPKWTEDLMVGVSASILKKINLRMGGLPPWLSSKESACKAGDFPGGSVVKNWPADAGDMGLISDPGRPHMMQGH